MATPIPTHLDTIILDNIVIVPSVGINRRTGNLTIFVNVHDVAAKQLTHALIFDTYVQYLEFVDDLISRES